MHLTPEQHKAAAFTLHGHNNLLISSGPGTGKTALLKWIAERLPADQITQVLAFNKHNAEELRLKLPPAIPVGTSHGLGHQLTAGYFKAQGIRLTHDAFKLNHLYAGLLMNLDAGDRKGLVTLMASLHRLLTARGLEVTADHLTELKARFGLKAIDADVRQRYAQVRGKDIGDERVLAAALQYGQAEALKQALTGKIDFDDRLLLPVHLNLQAASMDLILVDEAQDLSVPQQRLITHLGKRVVLVGDAQQSIFDFAGAAPGGLERFAQQLQAARVNLTVTFRCPQSHVALARPFTTALQARPGAPRGEVLDQDEAAFLAAVQPGDLVLCRRRAPLVALARKLTAQGRPATVRGHDFRTPLLALLTGGRTTGDVDVIRTLEQLQGRLAALPNSAGLPASERAAARQGEDDLKAACAFLADRPLTLSVAQIKAEIDLLMGEIGGAIELKTVHGAKGAEADTVWLYHPHLLPDPGGDPDEERCTLFVALTRGKKRLCFVHAPGEPRPAWLPTFEVATSYRPIRAAQPGVPTAF